MHADRLDDDAELTPQAPSVRRRGSALKPECRRHRVIAVTWLPAVWMRWQTLWLADDRVDRMDWDEVVAPHRSRLSHFVIDVDDLAQGTQFWSAALGAIEERIDESSRHTYRRLRLPDSEIRILLQRTDDEKNSKERMHIDIETDNVEQEVQRLEALGAVRYDHQTERGFDFWVLHDPFGNEFCVLQPEFPELPTERPPWP